MCGGGNFFFQFLARINFRIRRKKNSFEFEDN